MHAYIVHFLLSSVMRVPTIRFYTIAPLPFVCDSIQGRTQWNVFLFKVLTHCASAMSSFVYFTPVPSTWQFSLIPLLVNADLSPVNIWPKHVSLVFWSEFQCFLYPNSFRITSLPNRVSSDPPAILLSQLISATRIICLFSYCMQHTLALEWQSYRNRNL